jgi:hypothetical protein
MSLVKKEAKTRKIQIQIKPSMYNFVKNNNLSLTGLFEEACINRGYKAE